MENRNLIPVKINPPTAQIKTLIAKAARVVLTLRIPNFTKTKGIIYFPFVNYPIFFDRDRKELLEVGRDERVEIMGFITKNLGLLARFEECYNFNRDKIV